MLDSVARTKSTSFDEIAVQIPQNAAPGDSSLATTRQNTLVIEQSRSQTVVLMDGVSVLDKIAHCWLVGLRRNILELSFEGNVKQRSRPQELYTEKDQFRTRKIRERGKP